MTAGTVRQFHPKRQAKLIHFDGGMASAMGTEPPLKAIQTLVYASQAITLRLAVGLDHVMCGSEHLQGFDEPPAGIGLPWLDARPRGMRKSMVIAVPVLSKGQQTDARKIVPLHRQTIDHPALMSIAMRKMPNHPVTEQ